MQFNAAARSSRVQQDGRETQIVQPCKTLVGSALSRSGRRLTRSGRGSIRGWENLDVHMHRLLRPGLSWDIRTAMTVVRDRFVTLVPGDPWKGPAQP